MTAAPLSRRRNGREPRPYTMVYLYKRILWSVVVVVVVVRLIKRTLYRLFRPVAGECGKRDVNI